MSRARFFSKELDGEVIEVTGTEAHHLANVRRVKVGEEIELFDGAGQVVIGCVKKLNKKSVQIKVSERFTKKPAKIEVIVAAALAKGSRWDWLIEKCTELGASQIQPVLFERSVVKGSGTEEQLTKWNRRAIEAAKQSGQAYLPNICQPKDLEEVLQRAKDCLGLVGTISESARPILAVLEKSGAGRVVLLVGPEGGLSSEEQELAESCGYEPVYLGDNILRIETATVGLLAAIRAGEDQKHHFSSAGT